MKKFFILSIFTLFCVQTQAQKASKNSIQRLEMSEFNDFFRADTLKDVPCLLSDRPCFMEIFPTVIGKERPDWMPKGGKFLGIKIKTKNFYKAYGDVAFILRNTEHKLTGRFAEFNSQEGGGLIILIYRSGEIQRPSN